MYNKKVITRLVSFIECHNGIGDKDKLSELVKKEFQLTLDRTVYYCDDFAICYAYNGKNNKKWVSNTVLGLARIKHYDDRPLILCVVTHEINHLALMNSTFIKKTSHSSKKLSLDTIRGSVNVSNIMKEIDEYENEQRFFERMYAYHEGLSFEENYERIVNSTGDIKGRVEKFDVTDKTKEKILSSVGRAIRFNNSKEYTDLKTDLDNRVAKVQGEIAIAAFIRNHRIRGGIIEYLITDDGSSLKDQIIKALRNNEPLPDFKTDDKLGDYSKAYPSYNTETDIKTKVLFLDGNPKAYNIDKLLEFLAEDKSVYNIYLLGVDDNGKIIARLCSGLDDRLTKSAKVVHHWSGKNSRGTAQFVGHELTEILKGKEGSCIDETTAKAYLNELINK